MGGKTGGGAPQQQNMGAGGAGAGMSQQPSYNSMGKGGGGVPQNQMGQRGLMPMRPPGMQPQMMQQQYAQQRAAQQAMPAAPGLEGGINSLQGDAQMPPPAAATGASPGGPLSGRFGGWGAQQRGMGWGGGMGMGRWGGMGRNFGGPPPPMDGGGFGGGVTPAGAPGGLAALQAMAQQGAPTGAPLMADQVPQGYAVGGTVAPAMAAPARVGWSPNAVNFGASQGAGMFPSQTSRLPAITAPARYVAPPVQQAMWTPPAVAAKSVAAPTAMNRALAERLRRDAQPGRFGANSR
jgi:hypothetical protein